jgi:hypothetical protein
MPAFSPEDLETLAKTDEVRIQPTRKSGEPARRKIIWIVVDGDQAYIRSVRGTDGAWYKAARATGAGTLHAGSKSWPIELTLVSDPDVIARVSDALRTKYESRWQAPTASMLRDEVLSATLRISPA